MKPHLVLVRGLPGSGKTRFAKKHYPNYKHWETDMLFEKDGVYKFDPSMLKCHHTTSQLYVKQLLDSGHDVIVANTFTQVWEMQPYLDMTDNVSVFRMNCHWNVALTRQIHNVPEDSFIRMVKRFENYNGEVLING